MGQGRGEGEGRQNFVETQNLATEKNCVCDFKQITFSVSLINESPN